MKLFKCTHCGDEKQAEHFSNRQDTKSQKHSWCKTCFKTAELKRRYRDDCFTRNPSDCDNKLADKKLARELKEIWEME